MGLSVAGSGRMHSGPVSLSFDQILLEFGEIFWKVEAGHEKPPSRLRRRQDLDRIMGLSYAPRPHAVIAILRAQVKGLTAGALPTILSPIGIEDFSIFQISSHRITWGAGVAETPVFRPGRSVPRPLYRKLYIN